MRVAAKVERFALAGAFTIARGAKSHVDVVACEVEEDGVVGCGEGTPIYYRGETARGCVASIEAWARSAHGDRTRLMRELPPGAARNALDCALWDLAARRSSKSLWDLAGVPRPAALPTAWTLSLATPAAMALAAVEAAGRGYRLLKLKLGGDGDDIARVRAVRAAAASARLIADANESWAPGEIAAQAEAIAELGVEMIEQPLPHGADQALARLCTAIPLCADESCHTVGDLEDVRRGYSAVNVKLDKAGGLTAALELARGARAAGLEVMLGCMLGTSRAISFALPLAPLARWIDLDAPAMLATDSSPNLRYENGMIHVD